MDFSGSAGAASSFDTIPNGQLAYAVMTVRGLKGSASGGQYLDVELVIDQGQPFAGRKVWEMIGDPHYAGNSEAYRQMGAIAITRILEAGKGAGPNNPAGYQIGSYDQLSGLRVAVKLGIEAGAGGHPDKNRVAEWLTPNPDSQSGHKGWVQLQNGFYNTSRATPTQQQPAGGFGSAQPASQGGVAPANGGFQQPAGNASAPPSGASAPQQWGAPSATPATTSPSEQPGATPGWLAQAAGQ